VTLSVDTATEADVPAIVLLRTAAAEHLTRRHGCGHWSSAPTERSVRRGVRTARVLVARDGTHVVGTLTLATRKPWAIDPQYFVAVSRPVYLTDMAVAPAAQRQGVGRYLLQAAKDVARGWPGQAIRLDAYDAAAGASEFYARCGFREVGRVTYRGVPLVYFECLL
jgi:GNAT superfamily N-acetyltransferase